MDKRDIPRCGDKHSFAGTEVECRRIAGHEGDHGQSTMRWPNEAYARRCKDRHVTEMGYVLYCQEPKGHTGFHDMYGERWARVERTPLIARKRTGT